MISELEAQNMAEELVGKRVIPRLFTTEDVIELPIDRFARDDDGYYLVNAGLSVSPRAILNKYSGETIILELDELSLGRRRAN